MKNKEPDIVVPAKKDPQAGMRLINPQDTPMKEHWHLSWVYKGSNGLVHHGDNVFDISPRLTVKGLAELRVFIAKQMNCEITELTITSLQKLPE